MKKSLIAAVLAMCFASQAKAQYCPSCVQSSAIPQNAQFNISSATIRGQLKVGSLFMISSFTATSSATASTFIGSGTYLTGLNGSNVVYGTISTTVVSGNYYGVTGTGVLSTGTWQGNLVSSQYGGTGSNLVTANPGSLVYFANVGTMSALSPGTQGYFLQSNGSNPPSWIPPSQLSTAILSNIPFSAIAIGSVPVSWLVSDASLSTVSASKVSGNISGEAANIYNTLSITQLSTGTLINTIVASSITNTTVIPGLYGYTGAQLGINVTADGRIVSASTSPVLVGASSVTAGALNSNVTMGAAQITSGILGNTVQASSVAAGAISNVQMATGAYAAIYAAPSLLYIGGPLTVGSSVTINSSNGLGLGVPGSSVTAGAFFGNGVGLTGVPGTLANGTSAYFSYWSSSATLGNSQLSRDGSTSMTLVNSSFTLTGANAVLQSSGIAAPQGQLGVFVSTNLYVTNGSTVAAPYFVGNGAGLTGINALTGGTSSYFSYWTGPASLGASQLSRDGSTSMTLVGSSFTVNGNFGLTGTNNVITSSGVAALAGQAGVFVSTNLYVASGSTLTAGYIVGNGAGITNLSLSLQGGASTYVTYWATSGGLGNTNLNYDGSTSMTLVGSSLTVNGNIGLTGANSVLTSSGIAAPAGQPGIFVSTSAYFAGQSTVTAAYFVGSGAGLTGVPSTLTGGTSPRIPFWNNSTSLSNSQMNRDSATSLTVFGSSFTVLSTVAISGVNSILVSSGIAAPAGQPGVFVSTNLYATNGSTITAAYFSGSGANLTGISGAITGGAAGQLPYYVNSTTLGNSQINRDGSTSLTVFGSSFSVNGNVGVTGANNVVTSSGIAAPANGQAGLFISTSVFVNGSIFGQGQSSVTAAYFVGNGAGLTGITGIGSATGTITFVHDNLVPQITGVQTVFNLSQNPASANALQVFLDGIHLTDATDYTLVSGIKVTMSTPPASNTSSFDAYYGVNTSTVPGAAILTATETFTAPQTFAATGLNTYSITSSSGISITNGCLNFAGQGSQCGPATAGSSQFPFYDNFSNYSFGCVSTGYTFGPWSVNTAGSGCIEVVSSGTAVNSLLEEIPAVSGSPSVSHTSWVTGPVFSGPISFSAAINTVAQLRTGSAPNSYEVSFMLWNFTGYDSYYGFVPGTSSWQLVKAGPGQLFTILATGTSPLISTGTFYNVNITQDISDNINVYMNGSLVTVYQDTNTPFTSGYVVLGDQDAEGQFTNAEVTYQVTTTSGVLGSGTPGFVPYWNGVSTVTSNLSTTQLSWDSAVSMTAVSSSFTVQGNILAVGSSVTASAFFGDGQHLSNISGTLSGGSTPKLAYWTSTTGLGNSNVSQDGANSVTVVNSSFTVGGSAGMAVSTISATGSNGITVLSATTFTSSVTYLAASGIGAVGSGNSAPTFVSSATFANTLNLTTGNGFAQGGGSTMSVTGTLFFISSNSVTGSTCTAGSQYTAFSTYTVQPNTFVNPGDQLFIECMFQNSGSAPSAPQAGISSATIANQVAYGGDVSATDFGRVQYTATVYSTGTAGTAFPFADYLEMSSNGSGNYSTPVLPTTIEQVRFDTNAKTTFNCSGKVSGGGPINFIYMKVIKK